MSGRYLIGTRRAIRQAFKRFLQFYRVEMCNLNNKYKCTNYDNYNINSNILQEIKEKK